MVDIDEARLITYLKSNRAFFAPVVEQAVGLLDLRGRTRILDAGTGGGGGLVALARAAGPEARVLGVDRDPNVLGLAMRHAEEEGVGAQVSTRSADLLDLLSRQPADEPFDAIWASDVVWPGNFEDPADAVARMAGALAREGVLGLFTSNYYQSMFLPGHSRLERMLRTASELNWGLPGDGPTHYERHVHWMLATGLRDVRLHVLPRISSPVKEDPAARAYLEGVVWPELLAAARARGTEAGMSDDDIARAEALLTPGGRDHILDEPGYYLVHPALLVIGRR
ncbi:class I SAM-dependent methyltransferase [Streptomyces sp. 8K308]|uniref:class I SAM-dependent methyltransferase n=1 Tax=Streptomyces sp. 8K308 TaxID=2530388 RepID=UPI00104737B4|nr:class I SAM-dependent methyltransferase [Streptomyces sp. 8K308]TDC25825.1 class I SAM-dependent methyltransferase [Streptomyces sp. 8K308]